MSTRDKNVFISYGHNDFDEAILQFKSQLEAKLMQNDFSFFFDKDFLYEKDWEEKINSHIKASKWMLFLVSKRSISKDGYCLNELCRACEQKLKIIPILLDDSEVPLSINRLQRYDLKSFDGKVNSTKIILVANEIAEILLGNKEQGFADEDLSLKQALNPIDFQLDISKHYENFTGRENAFEKVNDWLYSEDGNIFLITAFPGFGKSAFSANCCWRFQKEIGAIHFCKFDNSDKADSKRIITSIAYSLAQKIPEYKIALSHMTDITDILSSSSQKNANRVFELLLVEPLDDFYRDEPILVIIDALDEAIWQGQINNDFCRLLRIYKSKLPSWLKILVTAREDSSILNELQYVSIRYVFTRELNKEDIKKYFSCQLKKIGIDDCQDKIAEKLFVKSEGCFEYAKEVINYIRKYKIDISIGTIDFLPTGLYGLFFDSFERIFGNSANNNYDDFVPLLELICVMPEELTLQFVKDYSSWNERELAQKLDIISSLISLHGSKLEVVHKTLKDWLISHNHSGKYFISEVDGYSKLLNYVAEKSDSNHMHNFYLKHYGVILIELIEKTGGTDSAIYLNKLSEILLDMDFQMQRLALLTLDAGFKMCIKELATVYKHNNNLLVSIFGSDTFKVIFSTYRRLLYNSGLFFSLKRIGFSEYLKTHVDDWGLDGEVGKIFYYYITEDFENTINLIKIILSKYSGELSNRPNLLAEIYNVKGLTLRKLVEFDKALKSFDSAIEYGLLSDYNFELSMAYLIKSKIEIRMGNIDGCVQDGETAIAYIIKAIKQAKNSDEKLSHMLFMAEEYRVLCDNMIWANDLVSAQTYMDKSQEIYIKFATTDRYYIRAQYTKLLLKIAKHEKNLLNEFELIEKQIYDSRYDLGYINILKSIYLIANEQNLEEAFICSFKSYNIYNEIGCFLEKEEAATICNNISDQDFMIGHHIESCSENKFIIWWIKFFNDFISKLIEET